MRIIFTHKILSVPVVLIMNIIAQVSVLVQFLTKTSISIIGLPFNGYWAGFELNGNPNQRCNIILFIFMVKNLEIWNLPFMVPKKACRGSLISDGANNFWWKSYFQNYHNFTIQPTLMLLLEIQGVVVLYLYGVVHFHPTVLQRHLWHTDMVLNPLKRAKNLARHAGIIISK